MDYYLVDFENTGSEGLGSIKSFHDEDEIYIFYSETCKNLTLDAVDRKVRFQAFKASVGTKDALDFQLSSYLGYLIRSEGSFSAYHIVSNDRGYDCLIDFWRAEGYKIDRISVDLKDSAPIAVINGIPSESPGKDKVSLQEIKSVLSEKDQPEEVLKIFNAHEDGQKFNNALGHLYSDTTKGGTVYRKLKPLLKAKGKTHVK